MEVLVETNSKKMAQKMAELTCELARVCNEKENYFAAMFNLTPAEFKCLRLFTNRNSLSIKELVHSMKITPGRITHILTSLEKKKFVTRRVDVRDKRNVIVQLTSKSEPFIKNLNESHIKLHEEILKNIPDEQKDSMINSMESIVSALRSWSKNYH